MYQPLLTPDALLSEFEYIKLLKSQRNRGVVVEEQVIAKKQNWKTHLKHGWEHMKKSLRDIRDDTKKLVKMRALSRPSKMILGDYLEYKRIQKDLLKFLPFSIFVLIPALEVILPFYLYLFPHAMPSQFYSEKSIGEIIQKKVSLQRRGYETLERKFTAILGEEYSELQGEIKRIKGSNFAPEKFAQKLAFIDARLVWLLARKWKTAGPKLQMTRLHLNELEACLTFVFRDFLSGVNLINRVTMLPFLVFNFSAKIFRKMFSDKKSRKDKTEDLKKQENSEKYQSLKRGKTFHGAMAFDWPVLRLFRKLILVSQMKLHFHQTRREDGFVASESCEELSTLTKQHLFEYSKRRGMNQCNESTEREFLRDYWFSNEDLGGSLETLVAGSVGRGAGNAEKGGNGGVEEVVRQQTRYGDEIVYGEGKEEAVELSEKTVEILELMESNEFRFWVSVLRFKYAQYLV